MSDSDRLEVCKQCMQEIKNRITDIDGRLSSWWHAYKVSLFETEMAALQLRKIYELVGFAALSADLDKYSQIRKRFEKDWNFELIMKKISRLNSRFLPQPIRRTRATQPGIKWHYEERPDAELTMKDLISRHGYLGNVLHATNPFSTPLDYQIVNRKIDTRVREIGQLLAQHRYVTDEDQSGYIIELNSHGVDVLAMKYAPENSPNV